MTVKEKDLYKRGGLQARKENLESLRKIYHLYLSVSQELYELENSSLFWEESETKSLHEIEERLKTLGLGELLREVVKRNFQIEEEITRE